MTRPSAAEIDDAILDAAAGLFASQGVHGTSVAQIAGAVGYSKTGLLHRFPSKQSLVDAVLVDTRARLDEVATRLAHLPVGPARDVAAVDAVAVIALERPGQVALVLAAFTAGPSATSTAVDEPLLVDIAVAIDRVFSCDAATVVGTADATTDVSDPAAVERAARVATALAGIAISTPLLTDFARQAGTTAARRLLTTVALDALGVAAADRPT